MAKKKRYKHITIHPSQGGALVGTASDDVPLTQESNYLSGSANYTEKLNFRREVDGELRREGWDLFAPETVDDSTPSSSDFPIRALHQFPGENGTPVTIAIVGPSVYRFFSENFTYAQDYTNTSALYSDDGTGEDYWTNGDEHFHWDLIYAFPRHMDAKEADGTYRDPFEGGAYRWEMVNVQNHVIINNGVDLPIVYNSLWDYAYPLYGLREQGVVSVGTIASFQDRLFCADLTVITGGYEAWFSQTGDPYTDPLDATHPFYGSNTYGSVRTKRYQYRMIYSAQGEPRLFNTGIMESEVFVAESGGIPGDIIVNANGSYQFAPDYNFNVGSESSLYRYFLYGDWAGEDHVVLYMTGAVAAVKAMDDGSASTSGIFLKLSGQGVNSDSYAVDPNDATALYATDAGPDQIGGTPDDILDEYWMTGGDWSLVNDQQNNISLTNPATGQPLVAGVYSAVLRPYAEQVHDPANFREFSQDGSRILKMVELADKLVVYRDSGFFFLSRSNTSLYSYVVDPRYRGGRIADFRHTIISLDGKQHLFMGASGIYSINRSSTEPKPVATFELGPPFWQQVPPELAEFVYAVDNPLTREIYINCPLGYIQDDSGAYLDEKGSPSATKVINWGVVAYDYIQNTLSTIDASFTAAAAIRRPRHTRMGPEQVWFVMGIHQADANDEIYIGTSHRQDARYHGVIARYGYGPPERGSTEPRRIYNRLGYGYISRLKSGLIDFGDSFSDKELRSYVLELSSKYGVTPITVKLSTTTAPQGTEQVETMGRDSAGNDVDFVVLNKVRDENMIPLLVRAPYIRDEITIFPETVTNTASYGDGDYVENQDEFAYGSTTVLDNPIKIVGRTFEVSGVDTRATTQAIGQG